MHYTYILLMLVTFGHSEEGWMKVCIVSLLYVTECVDSQEVNNYISDWIFAWL
jgi:hypothetical protein